MNLARVLQAPIVHAFLGKEFVEHDNPYDVGMTGLLGFTSGYRAMEHCDVLLAIGTNFPYPQFYPEKAKKIQIDSRGSQIGRRCPVDVGLIGTAKHTIDALQSLLESKADSSHLKDSVSHYEKIPKDLDAYAIGKPGTSPLHPEFVTRTLDEVADEAAVFTVDVGAPCIWAARYLRFNGKRSLIGFQPRLHGQRTPASIRCSSNLPQAPGDQPFGRWRIGHAHG